MTEHELREEPAPPAPPGSTPGGSAVDGDGETSGLGHTSDGEALADREALADAVAAVESDLAALETLQRERDDYLDTLKRLQADFDNFRKRTLKQQTDMLERAAQGLVDKLLPVLDAADLAAAHGGGEVVAPVVGLLVDILAKEGLETLAPGSGTPFDPTVHEAVAHEPGDGGPQEVSGVLRAGYRWKGALLRPAMVKVRG